MNRRHNECRSEGCGGEVVFKTVDGAFIDPAERQRGIRGSPNGYHRHSIGPTQIMSAYCKQHTCIHFAREEGCSNKKPPHDSVCAIHARCPVQDCISARGQYLDTKFEHVPGSVPRYARYELCFDHKCMVRTCQRGRTSSKSSYCSAHGCQAEGCEKLSLEQRNCCAEHECKTDGCRTIVEGEYPFCVIHIKCEVQNCNMARHLLAKTNEYLDFCTEHATCQVGRCRDIKGDGSPYCPSHTCRERDCDQSCSAKPYCDNHGCAEPSCNSPKSLELAGKQKSVVRFCPLHTCRSVDCYELVGPLALFCNTHSCCKDHCLHKAMAEQLCIIHFKEEYIAQGEREREAAERRRYSQPFRQEQQFNAPAQRSHHQTADSATESDTETETETDNEKAEPRGGPRRFTDSQLSTSGTLKPIPAPSKREWQRAPPSSFAQSNQAYPKKKKEKQQRHWADDTSPRGSKVGSITESLVAENGESYVGFDDGGPGVLPGSYPVGGGSKPAGNKRANSMPSESGASTATTRVL
ncbi:hypothetical protein B0T16DRAFT_83831 [Cercophora newfieldiana]|uniref:Uncharacterized protein n=1 Tax=Cercophora newfieldiana TaxID=92897 RepID=A0AA39YFF4_9PEZI|nr:hypothetical protein B0T16DRAFT_83831 [Cercophora newfieldiana]